MTKEAKAYIGLVFTFIIWGSLYVVSNVVLEYLPTFTVMFLRFLIAYLALSVIVAITKKNPEKAMTLAKEDRKYVIIMGVFGYGIAVACQLLGTKYAGASMASLINSLNPVTISLMAVFILKEALTPNKVIGILLAIFGVYLILGTGGNFNVFGILLSLIAVFGWSFVSVITRQTLTKYDALSVTRDAIGLAAIVNLFFAIIEMLTIHPTMHFNLTAVLGLLYLGVVCTGITYILWNKALATLPASNCSALYPLQPLTSTVMDIIFFKAKVGMNFVIGSLFIIAGVLIVLLGEKLFKKKAQ